MQIEFLGLTDWRNRCFGFIVWREKKRLRSIQRKANQDKLQSTSVHYEFIESKPRSFKGFTLNPTRRDIDGIYQNKMIFWLSRRSFGYQRPKVMRIRWSRRHDGAKFALTRFFQYLMRGLGTLCLKSKRTDETWRKFCFGQAKHDEKMRHDRSDEKHQTFVTRIDGRRVAQTRIDET